MGLGEVEPRGQAFSPEQPRRRGRVREGVGGQHHGAKGVRGALVVGKRLSVGKDQPRPVRAVGEPQTLAGNEEISRVPAQAQGVEGQHTLRRLRRGDPVARRHAAHTEPIHDEGRPALGQAAPTGFAFQRSREHRVVPVHGELGLRCEGARVVRHRMAETPGRQLPIGPVLGQAFGNGDRAAQGVVDGRGPGQERVALGAAGCIDRPQNRAVGLLPAQDEIDARVVGQHLVGAEVVMPGSGGQVGTDVGVEPLILDAGTLVVVEPAPIGQLVVGQPAIGRPGLLGEPARRQGHGRLHVVPRIAVAALEPRDHPVCPLHVGDRMGRGQHVGGREHPRHLGDRALLGTKILGGHAAAPWLRGAGPLRPGTPRGTFGLVSGTPATTLCGFVR